MCTHTHTHIYIAHTCVDIRRAPGIMLKLSGTRYLLHSLVLIESPRLGRRLRGMRPAGLSRSGHERGSLAQWLRSSHIPRKRFLLIYSKYISKHGVRGICIWGNMCACKRKDSPAGENTSGNIEVWTKWVCERENEASLRSYIR